MKQAPWTLRHAPRFPALAVVVTGLVIVLMVVPASAPSGRAYGAPRAHEGVASQLLEPSFQARTDSLGGPNPFSPLGTASKASTVAYTVTFQETGLAVGTNWSVYLNRYVSSRTTTIVFTEPAGTYYFVVPAVGHQLPSPSEGELNVTDSAVVETVTFATGYPVVFVALGLGSDALWTVRFNGTDLAGSSMNNTVIVDAENGSYNYTVFAEGACWTQPPSGSVTVQGGAVVQFVRFPAVTFQVAFFEVGLPLGTDWSVFFEGKWQSAYADQVIRYNSTCGSYFFSVGQVPGYSWVNPGSLSVIEVTGPTGYEIPFSPTTGFLSLPGDEGYLVVALLTGLTAALVAAGVYVRTRPPKPG